jgi:hypothetical protein
MIMWIYVGVAILGIIVGIILARAYKKKFAGIKHYEELRDKLTIRIKEEPKEEINSFPLFPFFGNLLGGFIVILIGVNLIPRINNEIISNVNSTSYYGLTESANTVLTLVPFFFIFGVVAMGLSLIIGTFKN